MVSKHSCDYEIVRISENQEISTGNVFLKFKSE